MSPSRLTDCGSCTRVVSLGSWPPEAYSFMGALCHPRRLQEETGPQVAERLKAAGVEVVLLTPT